MIKIGVVGIILVGFITWTVYVIRKINNWFTDKYIHLKDVETDKDNLVEVFGRTDFKNWNKFKMILGAIILLPIRVIIILILMITGWIAL